MTGPRASVLRELAGALPQTVRWPPVLVGWLLGVAVLAWKADDVDGSADAATLLRVVAVLLASSVVALVDDAAANVLAPVAVSLAWRRGVRIALAGAAVAVPWAAALLWVRDAGDLAAALTLECAALTTTALAVASGVARWSDARDPSVAAGPAVLGVAVFALFLPPRWAMFAPPGDGWRDAHLRWAVVLGAATAVLVATLRDPASGPVRRRSRTRRPGACRWR